MGRHDSWTHEEEATLRDKWGEISADQIAKRLKRTKTAVIVKSKRMKLGAFKDRGEMLTASQVATLMGVDFHTVSDYWMKKCGLPFRKIAARDVRKFKYVHMDALIKWLHNNPDKWDSRRVELFALGSEPDWLKEKRTRDNSIPARSRQKWTPIEDAALISMFRKGCTGKEIAASMGRSEAAIRHRIQRVDMWGCGKAERGN